MTSRNLARAIGVGTTVLWLVGCSDDTTGPGPDVEIQAATAAETAALVTEVRQLAASNGMTALQRPAPIRPELSHLGQVLAFDKVLSGNRDISCMTCHLAGLATVDGHSTAIGTGATGLGPSRVHPQGTFVHRNAPPLFNLSTMSTLTWDGRVFKNPVGTIRTPGTTTTVAQRAVMEFGTLSALPMFPVLSRPEMRGTGGNELAAVPDDDKKQRVWKGLMSRLGAIPEYRTMFEAAYPGQVFDSMTFAHAGNAMGGWIAAVFTLTNSPWDRFLAGNDAALTDVQLRGAKAFLTTAKCAQCHNGPLLTDSKFHNVAIPQVGPGFGNGVNGTDDFGRFRQTGRTATRYQFRTAPLRNVELTAPYGHDGAIVNLRAWVDHYSQSDVKLRAYNPAQLEPLLRNTLQPTVTDILATRDIKLKKLVIQSDTVDDITEFLKALTDPAARNMRQVVPASVPSGLPVDALP